MSNRREQGPAILTEAEAENIIFFRTDRFFIKYPVTQTVNNNNGEPPRSGLGRSEALP